MNGDLICPECKQGKHQNCTLVVLVDQVTEGGEYVGEDWVECECAQVGHD